MSARILSAREKPSQHSDASQFSTIEITQLRDGVKLRFPLFDERNVLLLAGGSTLTRNDLDLLAQRGVTNVKVHRSELLRLSLPDIPCRSIKTPTISTRSFTPTRIVPCMDNRKKDAEAESAAGMEMSSESFLKNAVKHGANEYDRALTKRFTHDYQESVDQINQLYGSISEIKSGEIDMMKDISAATLSQLAEDMDLFVSLGISPESDKYPARHSQQAAMLAMAVGANLALDKKSLVEIGVGCLAHDVGMLHIKDRIFQNEKELDPVAFLEITRHPMLTFDLMRSVDQIAGRSRIVAYQMHERCDGSGYPRRRVQQQIHPLSRIAAVADVFTALISPRPHRPGMMPYYAMEQLLKGSQQGLFDAKVVRALLKTVSLFPIGSFIQLNDGRVGRVIRTSGEAYTKPVVEVWVRGCLQSTPDVIDLSQDAELQIECALPSLAIPKPELSDDNWE